MSKPVTLFRTTNWSSYRRSLKRRGSLMVWFDPEMAWFAAPGGKAGHPERFSAAAIRFCLTVRVLFGLVAIVAPLVRATMATRQATGFVESLLSLSGPDWPVPDCNSSPILEPAEHDLDAVSTFVAALVISNFLLAGFPPRDAGAYALVFQRISEPIGIVAPIRQHPLCFWEAARVKAAAPL